MLFLLWWCVDDHLAASLGVPGLGHVAWWVVFLLDLALSAKLAAHSRSTT
jgi:hypothetical protein